MKKTPAWKNSLKEAINLMGMGSVELKNILNEANREYLHWDKFRFKKLPKTVKPEVAWSLLKLMRTSASDELPLHDERGRPFAYYKTKEQDKRLNYIDKYSAGSLSSDIGMPDDFSKMKLIVNGLTEEAISSSQLEGASTTRKVARRMIELNEKPKTKDARMIMNNYIAMSELESWKDRDLSVELLLELHAIITQKTLDSADEEGRFRKESEDINVIDNLTKEVVHRPPHVSSAHQQIDALCKFANAEDDTDYIHPFIKASVLHFMIGYIHPFTDGNGRCARALFYWFLIKKGYWMFKFLTISTQIKKKEWNSRYSKAYLYTEDDDLDLSYFINYKIKLACKSIEDFFLYLKKKEEEQRMLKKDIIGAKDLNSRQMEILNLIKKNPSTRLTVDEHRIKNKISYETARGDLLEMAKKGFIDKLSQGNKFIFIKAKNTSF